MARKPKYGEATTLEWLTWPPGATEPLATHDNEAWSVMFALAGHACERCGELLSARHGLGCCSGAYCPLCGRLSHSSSCGHCVVRGDVCCTFENRRLTEPDTWRLANELRGPAGTPNKRHACPVWDEAQIALAFDADQVPYVTDIFGANLRDPKPDALASVLVRACFRPDARTVAPGHFDNLSRYFCTDPDAGHGRAVDFLTRLSDGVTRLQAMQPVWRDATPTSTEPGRAGKKKRR